MRRLVIAVLLVAACGGDSTLDGVDAPAVTFDARGGCVPTTPSTEVCDGADNDCNGKTDDVDTGGDGIFDCQRILLIGAAGANPSANFVAWLTGNGSQVQRVLTDGSGQLTSALLANVKVVILDRLARTYSAGEAATLAAWVDAGGGLMVMTGYSGGAADLDNPNSLLAPFGLAYQPGLVSGPVTSFATHPITAGLSSVTFSGGFVAAATAGGSTTVATLPSGAAGIVQARGAGRIFVWGDEWVTFDSEWSSMPMIKTFWVNALGWLEGLR